MDEDDNNYQKTMILRPSARSGENLPEARLICRDRSVLPDEVYGEISLMREAITIGRSRDNSVSLKVEGVSRQHARIFPAGDMWGVQDLGSTNGVRVNGKPVNETWLKSGDLIEMGRLRYEYQEVSGSAAEAEPVAQASAMQDKTVVMRPGQVMHDSGATGASPQADVVTSPEKPKANPARVARRGRARPAVKKEPGSSLFLWLLAVLIAILAFAIASFFV